MNNTLKILAEQQGKAIGEELLSTNYKIEDSAKFVVDVPTGWVLSLTQSRSAMTDSGSQVDSTTIKEK